MKASYSSKKGVARNLLFFLLLFFMLPSMAIAQSTVRGIVTDDNGEPLPGVAVVKDGTSLAVSTDIDGRFAIKASEGDVLKFSYVGMESKTVKVGKENELNVKLSSSLTELDEVVVVGYGTQKKVNLTGAVQSVPQKRRRFPGRQKHTVIKPATRKLHCTRFFRCPARNRYLPDGISPYRKRRRKDPHRIIGRRQ